MQEGLGHQEINNTSENNGVSNSVENNDKIHQIELSSAQLVFLLRRLPQGYSFQVESKPIKREISHTKNAKQDIPKKKSGGSKHSKQVESSLKQIQGDSVPIHKTTSMRATKSNTNRYVQDNDAIYEKYNANIIPKEINKRNSYEGLNQSLKPCIKILNLLKNSKTSWAFRQPVDPVALSIPQYLEIIKQPMDLSTIQNNLRSNQYITPTQFHADVGKIIKNSYTFNASNLEFTRVTQEFEQYYKRITAEPVTDIQRSYSTSYEPMMQNQSMYKEKPAQEKKKKRPQTQFRESNEYQPITLAEKKELSINIKKLAKEHMKGIVEIVNQGKIKITGEFDLKELQPHIIRKLQEYVRQKLSASSSKAQEKHDVKQFAREDKESSFELSEEDES